MTFRRFAAFLVIAAVLCRAAGAQVLAKKGWIGSGMTVESWWDGAILYQIDPVNYQDSNGDGFGDLKGITQRLDYVQSLGVDAIVLSPLQLQPEGPPLDPKYGTEEDFDALIQESSRHKIRLFVDLQFGPTHSIQQLGNAARFWLSRGIAGLRLIPEPGASPGALTPSQTTDRLRELHRLCAGYAGSRVLLWDLPEAPPRNLHPGEAPQMIVGNALSQVQHLTPNDMRRALSAVSNPESIPVSAPVSATDATNHPRTFDRLGDANHDVELAKLLASTLLLSRGAPMLYFGQEIGMAASAEPTPMQWGGEPGFTTGIPWIDMGRNSFTANVELEDKDAGSLLNWYRRLSAMRHSSEAIRNGTFDLLAETNPDVVAWVRKSTQPGSAVASIVTLCNLTDRQLLVSVGPDLKRLGAAPGGATMHTLASSWLTTQVAQEAVSGYVSANGVTLPPYGIYIGELPHQAGNSTPSRRSRRSARTSP